MSEVIFRLLLHLYPSRFRQEYGDEALQLFRDRTHDETGVWPSVRLWLDLLTDLVISLPRTYCFTRPEVAAAQGKDLFGRHADVLCVRYCISRTTSAATRGAVVADYACIFSQADERGRKSPT